MQSFIKLTSLVKTRIGSLAILGLFPLTSFASQTGSNSWEHTLDQISKSLTGPIAYSIATMAIVVCGIIMAFADLQGGAKRFVQAATGLSIAFGAAAIVSGFLGFKGALI